MNKLKQPGNFTYHSTKTMDYSWPNYQTSTSSSEYFLEESEWSIPNSTCYWNDVKSHRAPGNTQIYMERPEQSCNEPNFKRADLHCNNAEPNVLYQDERHYPLSKSPKDNNTNYYHSFEDSRANGNKGYSFQYYLVSSSSHGLDGTLTTHSPVSSSSSSSGNSFNSEDGCADKIYHNHQFIETTTKCPQNFESNAESTNPASDNSSANTQKLQRDSFKEYYDQERQHGDSSPINQDERGMGTDWMENDFDSYLGMSTIFIANQKCLTCPYLLYNMKLKQIGYLKQFFL